jgi:hypothetical protein
MGDFNLKLWEDLQVVFFVDAVQASENIVFSCWRKLLNALQD